MTPDSFSDGGLYNDVNAAIAQAAYMRDCGADILDIGGQSARPNAVDIDLDTELYRVVPVIEMIRADSSFDGVAISIDTTKSAVARAAVEAGADMVNDISGAIFDGKMLQTVAELKVPIILMHLRGNPKTMQQLTEYNDLVGEISGFLRARVVAAIDAGIAPDQIVIDPGIGFAKTAEQSLQLLQELEAFRLLNCPILVGTSRKSFIGKILDRSDPSQRVWGTAATCCAAIAKGANILRVHDVAEMADVMRVADAIWKGQF